MRIAVASIMQESNTFAPGVCRWSDFTVAHGADADQLTRGSNAEMAGALATVREAGADAEPLVYAWAMPGGPVEHGAFTALRDELLARLTAGPGWDAVVLSLHGAMVTTELADADGAILAEVRRTLGDSTPIIVSLDLHANVTEAMIGATTATIAYHTDPHVDQASSGRRAALLALRTARGEVAPTTALAKRPMIVPAETMSTTTGPIGELRRRVDAEATEGVLDVSLLPVQPWLDVPELGFAALVTTDGRPDLGARLAQEYAETVWQRREEFRVERLLGPTAAVAAARRSSVRPFIIAHSADAPTAGAAGDNPIMIATLLEHGPDLRAYIPIVDAAAVEAAYTAGLGKTVDLLIGAQIDHRWGDPVRVSGVIERLGAGSYRLVGASYTGMLVSMGRFAVIASGELRVMATERPAWSADPGTFLHAGLDPGDAQVIVVRSCSDFRPNFPEATSTAVTLDVAGPATPRLESLQFHAAPRPLWPIDSVSSPARRRSGRSTHHPRPG